MCCGETETFDLPAEVIEAIAHYRRLRAERGGDWGDERVEFSRWAGFPYVGEVFEVHARTGNLAAALREVVARDVLPGVVVIAEQGVTVGPLRAALPGTPVPVHVVTFDAAGGVDLATVEVDGAEPVIDLGGRRVAAVRPVPAATVRLTAPQCVRWSVTDADGTAWFPPGVPRKWDYHGRPFFHGHDVTVAVPAGEVRVGCARGLGFGRTETAVRVDAGGTAEVAGDPPLLFDPPASGWYGGDLHVHLNYSGDLVCTPEDAARMQRGEGLHLLNLVAGNFTTSMVYDRDLFERTAGTDLPWSGPGIVARAGVEFRNDLLGHVHALGPSGPPTRYQTGHERSEHPDDWPPNRDACAELQSLGATVGYAHPVWTEFPVDGSTERFFANPRSVEARELVADAALGVVDSIDVISPFDHDGAVFLYHRLLSCGLRLAATAGTDCFLSFSRMPGPSNPPGWGRVYAHLDGAELSVAAFQDAIRAGRTVVTNGPWLTLDVDGAGPGAVLDRTAGAVLAVRATVTGPGATTVALVGPEGVLASSEVNGDGGEVRADLALDGPTWIAATARGEEHPDVLDYRAFAHTSPVYVDVAGARVARAADARWCLDLLDTLEAFVAEHGHFAPETREERLGDLRAVLDEARGFYRAIA